MNLFRRVLAALLGLVCCAPLAAQTTENTNALWLAEQHVLLKLSPAGELLLRVDGLPVTDLETDPLSGAVWVGQKGALSKYRFDGLRLLHIPLARPEEHDDHGDDDQDDKDDDDDSGDGAVRLALDPERGRPWIARGRLLIALEEDGRERFRITLAEESEALAFNPRTREVWVASERELLVFSDDGALAAVLRAPRKLEHAFLAAAEDGSVFLAAKRTLALFGPDRSERWRVRLAKDARDLAVDPRTGDAWVAQERRVVKFSLSGQVAREVEPFARPHRNDPHPRRLAVDPSTGDLWAASRSLVARVGSSGSVSVFDRRFRHVRALAYFADLIPPELEILFPPAEAVIATNAPTLRLEFSDAASGIDPASLHVRVDGQDVSEACTQTPEGSECPLEGTLAQPDGLHTLEAEIADQAGNRTEASHSFVVDTIPPAAPDVGHIQVEPTEDPALWDVIGEAGSVEPGSLVTVTNTRTGQIVTTVAGPDGSFRVRIAAEAGDILSIRFSDLAGNTSSAVSLAVSQAPPQTEDSGFVSGLVLDRASSQPLAGVRVRLRGESATVVTDAAGRFTFPTPGTGSFTVFLEKAGYVTARRDASVVSQRHASVGTVLLAALDTASTVITPAGGTHTDSTGKLLAIFPPGAVDQAITVSATYFPRDQDFPLPIPEGIVFVAGVQMTPEHTSFQQPVTLRFANDLGLDPGTQVPFAFASHDDEDSNEGFYDPGMGVVTADGAFIEAVVPHFSCVSLGLKPPQGQSQGGSCPACGPPPGATCPGGQNNSRPTSSICISDGGVRLEQRLATVGALGGRDGVELSYSSLAAFPRPLVSARSQLSDLYFATPPERQTWKLSIEGVERQFSFQGTTQASHFSAFWDGLNGAGSRVPTGVYDYLATATAYFRGPLFSSDSFGSLATTPTNVSSPEALPYSAPVGGSVILNDQSSSPFGAGWSLTELERLYPQPNGTVLWIDGSGNEAVMRPGTSADRFASGLGRAGGLARDVQGNLYVGDFASGTIRKVAPNGSVSPFASVEPGLSDLAFDRQGNLYALSYFGRLYRVSPAGGATLFTSFGFDLGDLVVAPSGDIFVIDSHHPAIYRVTPQGQVGVFAGYSFGIGSGLLTYPSGIVMDGAGNLYVSNNYNTPGAPVRCGVSFVSKISPDGNHSYYALDLNAPRGLALDVKGNLYVADTACDGSNTVSIKAVSLTGAVTTLQAGFPGPLPSGSLPFGFSNDLVADESGSLYLVTESGELFRSYQTTPPAGVRIDYNGPASEFAKLVRHEDGSFTRTETDGTRSRFDAQGGQTARIETDGDTISYAYDAQGRLISRTNAVGQVWGFDYAGSALASVTDPAGRTTRFAVDAPGNLVQVTHPDGSVVGFTYDARHLLTSKTDARGFTTSYGYEANGRATEVDVPTGETRRFDPGRVRAAVENLPPGVGTPENLAPPVLTADLEDRYTDGRGLTTTYVSNAFGSVTRTVRPDGVVHEIERDADNQPTLLREPNGGLIRQKYDAKGNLLEYDQEGGLFYRIQYHPVFSKPVVIDDALGQRGRTTFLYDGGGNLIETTDPRSVTTRYTRDAHGLPTRVELGDGAVVEYTYDGFGRVTTIKDPLLRVTTIEYDAAGNPTTITDPAGRQTRYTYDAMSRRTSALDALNGVTTFTYHAGCSGCDFNQEVLTSLTDARGQTTTFEYDAIGQLVRSTDALGRSRSFSYDLNRNLTSVTDAREQTISFEYDANDRLIRKLRPEGGVDYAYDSVGNLLSLSDENSSLALAYDVANRLIRSTPGGLLPAIPIENAYDRRNLRTSQTAPWNNLSYRYDAAGNLDFFSGIPGASPTLSLSYDRLNRRVTTSGLVAESLAYDFAGQLLFRGSSDAAAALAWQYAYDALGNRTREVRRETFRSAVPIITATPDPSTAPTDRVRIEGRTSWPRVRIAGVEHSVGLDGRFSALVSVFPGPNQVLVEALSASGGVAASHTLSITGEPASGIELGELVGGESSGGVFGSKFGRAFKVSPDGTIEQIPGLDGSFEPTHIARAAEDALYVWSFSDLYRLEGAVPVFLAAAPFVPEDVGLLPDGTWALTSSFDSTLYRFDVTTGEATPWITFTAAGPLRLATNASGEVIVGSADGKVFRVSPAGDVTEWTVPVGMFGVSDVALDDGGVAFISGFLEDPNSGFCLEAGPEQCLGLKRLLPGGQVELLEGNPSRIMADGPGSLYFLGFRVLLRIPPGGTTAETISLSPQDLVIQVEIDPPTEITRNFAYDSLDRLTSAEPGETYSYDPVGNRTQSHLSEIQVYDGANQLVEDDSFTYSYDENGNLEAKFSKLGGGTTTYTWDSEDRLIRVELPGTVASYVYDPLGRRIQKTVNGELTRYLYDGEDIVAELDATNAVVTSFVHGPGIDEPLAMVRDGRTYTYHRDALGSITHLTDQDGLVVQRYAYDAYGNVTAELDPDFIQPYAFTGRERDRETGLLYYRARYYDPRLGRFISEDPSDAEANLFAYVANNPTNRLDPSGLINIPFGGNARIEKALLASAEENGFTLSKDSAKQIREEMSLGELKRLNDEKVSQDKKLDVLEDIAKRVLKKSKDPKVNKELQDMIDARKKSKQDPAATKNQCP